MKKIYSYILLILCFIRVVSFSQTYNFKNYNTEQGLPQSQVICIFQDHSGNIWFGTNSGGVGKFNGNKFTTITDNDGLINNVVFAITENNKHEILFGTSKGLSVLSGKKILNFSEKNGLKNSWIFDLLQDGDKTWIATQEGVYTYENGKINKFNLDSTLSKSAVFKFFLDSKNNIWFGTTQNGAICFNRSNNTFTNFTKKDGLTEELIFSISENSSHKIILGSAAGLFLVENNKLIPQSQISRQEYVGFRSLAYDKSRVLWMGTSSEGLYKFDNGQLRIYNLKNGLTNNSILSVLPDREGNIWIGTDGSGVYKFSNEKFTYYTKNNGLSDNYINAVAQDKTGNYWIALRNNGLAEINGNVIKEYKFDRNHPNAISDNNITCILPLDDGKIYFGTSSGIFEYNQGIFKTLYSQQFRQQYILSLYQSSDKKIWIGTNNGLFYYENNTFTQEEGLKALTRTGIPFPIFSIIEDRKNNIWLGTENGLIKKEGKHISFLNDKNNFTKGRVLSSCIDAKNNLWFGTDEGIYNYNHNVFTKISQKNGLYSNFVNFIKTDDNNRLIIGLNTGLNILNLDSFYKNKIEISYLGKEDGLLSLESNFNACYKDRNGKILIGTIDGLEIYDPRFDTKNKQEAITRIADLKLFFGQEDVFKYSTNYDSSAILPKNLQLPFNKNHLTFHFIGVSLTAPEKVMYQYKLVGVDEDWTPPTSKTEATYSSLQPGHYTFMVKAMNNDGVWNKEPVTFEFDILAPWYKTWWFYSLCVVVIIGGIILYNYVKTKKLIADKQKLEQVVDVRTRELRDEKEKVELINKEVIEQKTIIEHKNIEITDSIKYAKNIQEALLPNLGEIDKLFKNNFVLYMPKDIVSGDFYWFAKSGDTNFVAAVDCTGHGVPGAFMSIVGNTLLHKIVNEEKITKPGDILLELHKGVKIALHQSNQESERRDGMDITLCAFTKGTNTVQYAGANRPLWIYRKNDNYNLEIIKATKFPIGGLELEENRVYQNHEITVSEGDCLYLFSDGYADQFGGPKGKKFMLTNLQKTISEIIELPMPIQKQKLAEAFNNWKQDTEQIDDVLVIGVKI